MDTGETPEWGHSGVLMTASAHSMSYSFDPQLKRGQLHKADKLGSRGDDQVGDSLWLEISKEKSL